MLHNVFPIRVQGSDNLKYIFPNMQKSAQAVIDLASEVPSIEKVLVFGSAITWNCGVFSDLDIALDAPSVNSMEELAF